MSKSENFIKQAGILAAASLIVRLLGFLYRLPLTAMIGDEGNGIYGSGYYLYIFFLILSSAGLPTAISKMVSERIADNQYKNAHRVFYFSLFVASSIGLICSLFLGIGAKWFSGFVNSPRSYYSILALSPTVFIVAMMSVFRGYFQGMKNTVPTAISQISEQVFNAVFSILLCYIFLKATNNVALGAAGGTAGTGVGALFGLVTLVVIYFRKKSAIFSNFKNDYSKNVESGKKIIKELFKTSIPIIIGTAIFSTTNLIDMKMVNARLIDGGYTELQAVKMYGLLTGKYATLTQLPLSISAALATAAIPSIAGLLAKGEGDTANIKINEAIRVSMIISVPAAIGLGVLSNEILQLLFPNHSDGGYLLRYGAISVIILAYAQILTGMLQGTGYMHIPAIATLCGAIVKIPITYFLVPIKEITIFSKTIPINVGGAVISTICCYLTIAIINSIALKKVMGKKFGLNISKALVKPLFASIMMGLVCYIFYNLLFLITKSNALSTIFAISVGSLFYLAFMLYIKGLTRKDLKKFGLKK